MFYEFKVVWKSLGASYTYDNMIFVGQIISFYSKAPIELHNIKV